MGRLADKLLGYLVPKAAATAACARNCGFRGASYPSGGSYYCCFNPDCTVTCWCV
ncbi:hypothetical protein [Longispora albida]|uniref:hypothetical protein n=1 Tax=Longispora albida TaxID=203523 RepID=UPI00036AE891|nr:hypothetical protein [Longispora albida]